MNPQINEFRERRGYLVINPPVALIGAYVEVWGVLES